MKLKNIKLSEKDCLTLKSIAFFHRIRIKNDDYSKVFDFMLNTLATYEVNRVRLINKIDYLKTKLRK